MLEKVNLLVRLERDPYQGIVQHNKQAEKKNNKQIDS